MSFNLNKNGESSGSPKKSNFDLSKSDSVKSDSVKHSRNSKNSAYWFYAALALMVIGGAAWFLLQQSASGKLSSEDTSEAAVGKNAAAGVKPDTEFVARQPVVDDSVAVKGSSNLKKAHIPAITKVTAAKAETTDIDSIVSAPFIAAFFKAGLANPRVIAKSILEIRRKVKNGRVHNINVFGYASSEGDLAINQTISQARADAFKKLLVGKGIIEGIIHAEGKGIESPIASNETEQGRAKNRRVEILLQR